MRVILKTAEIARGVVRGSGKGAKGQRGKGAKGQRGKGGGVL